jgi:hypothetical protein
MNNWLKIGLPILLAVLLIVATVGVTLAIDRGGRLAQATPAYQTGDTANAQYAYGPRCHGYTATGPNNYCGMRGWYWNN